VADTERTKAELLDIFADGQLPGSIDPQDMRDYVVTTDNVDTRFSTGLITGGEITINGGDNTKVDIAAGEGVYVDNFTDPLNPVRVKVSWSTILAESALDLVNNTATFFGLDLSLGMATVVKRSQEFTAEERRDFVVLAPAIHPGIGQIDSIGGMYSHVLDERQTLVDLADSIGQINVRGGNVYSANGTLLTIDKSSGATFFVGVNYQNSKKTPNITTDILQSPVPFFFYTYQDGGGDFINGSFISSIDPEQWDDGTGTLKLVTSNQFTIQRIWFFPLIDLTVLHYGQTVYGNLADAKAAINTESFIKNPLLNTGFRAWLIVKRGTTDLTIASDAEFLAAGMFGDILRPR